MIREEFITQKYEGKCFRKKKSKNKSGFSPGWSVIREEFILHRNIKGNVSEKKV